VRRKEFSLKSLYAKRHSLLDRLPDFWPTVFGNGPEEVQQFLSSSDLPLISSLKSFAVERYQIESETTGEPRSVRFTFEFAENEFFTNKTITKTYFYQNESGYGGDFIYDHAEGDEINWTSPENNLTVRIEKRKQRNKHTKATRTIEKTIPEPSFFSFFSPPKAPSVEEEDEEDEDDETEYPEDLEQQLEIDYQLGEEIKEKLIPRAIDWYTGEALQYEDLDDDEFDEDEFDDEDGEEDDDEDDDDDDDDDDDEDEEGVTKAGSQKQPPAECNQS